MHFKSPIVAFSLLFAWSWATQVIANELTAVEKKAATCFECHGEKGKSANPAWPSLAAQQSVYLVNQLKAYKSGERKNAEMQAKASTLSNEDINDFGAYFAVQKPDKVKASVAPALVNAGKDKATVCLGCHGPAGEGKGEFPRLAGQQPQYLEQQLTNYKNGSRKNAVMGPLVSNLTAEDIKALAAFFNSL